MEPDIAAAGRGTVFDLWQLAKKGHLCWMRGSAEERTLPSRGFYTTDGRLRRHTSQPVLECNKRCCCGATCPNRVVNTARLNSTAFCAALPGAFDVTLDVDVSGRRSVAASAPRSEWWRAAAGKAGGSAVPLRFLVRNSTVAPFHDLPDTRKSFFERSY